METAQSPITIGLYGKHPSFGDFVTAGLSQKAQDALERWLHQVMPPIRDGWGEHWEAVFDASPVIRFWYGSAAVDDLGPLCGIMAPSRDKVGRRFPLIAAVSGAAQPAPVEAGDQSLYDALLDAIAGFVRPGTAGAGDFAAYLRDAIGALVPAPAQAIEPAFWAARADGDLERLWDDVAPVDHARATALRSYLWCDGPGGAAVHVTRGLPGAEVLAWLMTDAVRPVAPPAAPMPTLDDITDDSSAEPDIERTVPPTANNNDTTVRPVAMPPLTD